MTDKTQLVPKPTKFGQQAKAAKGQSFDADLYGDGLEYNDGGTMPNENDQEDSREAQLRAKLEAG